MSKVIKFESGSIKEEDKKIKIKFGDTFKFEFIQDQLTPVHFINTNSKIDKYINEMSADHTIFVDFEFVPSYFDNQKEQPPPICVFTFTCSKGVYVFKQTNLKPNQQLKEFLSAESGHEFIGFSLRDSASRLKEMFGEDFSINLEDTLHSRLKPNKISVIRQIFEKFGNDMLIKITTSRLKQKYWNGKFLKFEMFTFTAAWCFVVFHCYDKFPEKVESPENDDENDDENEVKKVGKKDRKNKKKPPLHEEAPEEEWKIGQEREIEFFPNQFTTVTLLNSDRDLKKFIPIISKSPVISLDFRLYTVDFERKKYMCIYTFATSTNSYVFYKTTKEKDDRLKKFLSKENGLKFIGYDIKKVEKVLKKLYGEDFDVDLTDVCSLIPKKDIKTLVKPKNRDGIGCDKKNDYYYEIVTMFLDEPCERLQQFYNVRFNKYTSIALLAKKSAMWSVVAFKMYEKLTDKNIKIVKNDAKAKKKVAEPKKATKKDDEPKKATKKVDESKKATKKDDDEFEFKKQKTYDDDDDDDDGIIIVDDENDNDDDDDIVIVNDENDENDDDDESDDDFDENDDDFDENDEEDDDDFDF